MANKQDLPVEEVNKTAGEANQQEAMPASEQKPAEQQLEEAKRPADDTNKAETLDLPEDVSERTRQQFEKLKKHNQELAKKLEELQKTGQKEEPVESVFDSFNPKVDVAEPQIPNPNQDFNYLNQQQISNIANQFVDQDGNVDIDGLNQALYQANLQAKQAIEEARKAREEIARWEENRQTKEAYAKYPQLDPLQKDKFDRKFYELVRDRMVSNFSRGIKKTFREVADDIAKVYNPVNKGKIKEEAVAEFKKRQEARKQGPIEEGKGQPPTDKATLEELRRSTREAGGSIDNPALEERLRRLGIIS